MLDKIQWLCQRTTGSQCAPPRWTNWGMIDPSTFSLGTDVAEVMTAGAAAAIPVNFKLMAGTFSTGLIKKSGNGAICVSLKGYGGGAYPFTPRFFIAKGIDSRIRS